MWHWAEEKLAGVDGSTCRIATSGIRGRGVVRVGCLDEERLVDGLVLISRHGHCAHHRDWISAR